MYLDISEERKHSLWSFIELLCQYFKTKKLNLAPGVCVGRDWFVENRQRIGCLPSVPGGEEKFAGWFNLLEESNENVWVQLLSNLSDARVSSQMYEAVKDYSPFVGKLIVVRRGFDGKIYLSKHEGRALMKNVFPVNSGQTFLVFSIEKQAVLHSGSREGG